tara:strand:- start:23 stop:406 length:384 start_codon:yes stop_codon:yes gene_type:complete
MGKHLTDKQQKFVDVLFSEAEGDLQKAKHMAGYSPNVALHQVVNSVKEEVIEATKTFMAFNAPKAAYAIVSGVDTPTQLGMRDKLNAAKDLLDRTGIVKTEKVEVQSAGGLMILPAKDEPIEDDDED